VSNRRGVAIMLVAWLIVIIGTVTSAVIAATRSSTDLAVNYRADVVARYAAESGVAYATSAIEAALVGASDESTRAAYLNDLGRLLPNGGIPLGDARMQVVLIDPGTRLDVNFADESSLATLFGYFTGPVEAETAARRVREYMSRPRDGGSGAAPTFGVPRPLESVDELARIPGIPKGLLERAAEFLTVDGDGSLNRMAASDTVLAAARGELRDQPSRLLVVSRGWLDGHPLTHEIQALYAISGGQMTLIKWRERLR
jgi:type II secretory pathway component PulK